MFLSVVISGNGKICLHWSQNRFRETGKILTITAYKKYSVEVKFVKAILSVNLYF